MSTLSALVKFRSDLLDVLEQLESSPMHRNSSTVHQLLIDNPNIPYKQFFDEKIRIWHDQNIENNKNIIEITQLINTVNRDIDILAEQMLVTKDFQEKFKFNNYSVKPNNYNAKMASDHQLKSIIQARVSIYSNHLYPGLNLGSKFQEWIDFLIAGDPLYITNYKEEDLFQILKEYPEVYQRRVRVYEIKNQNYAVLPQKQFSVVFSWDYLPWIVQSELDQILVEVYNLLRPGGAFIFNYNNCDLISTATQAQSEVLSWASSHRIKNLCEQIGYEIVSFNDYDFDDPIIGYVSWAEIRKPGTLETIKLQQVLGEIISK